MIFETATLNRSVEETDSNDFAHGDPAIPGELKVDAQFSSRSIENFSLDFVKQLWGYSRTDENKNVFLKAHGLKTHREVPAAYSHILSESLD